MSDEEAQTSALLHEGNLTDIAARLSDFGDDRPMYYRRGGTDVWIRLIAHEDKWMSSLQVKNLNTGSFARRNVDPLPSTDELIQALKDAITDILQQDDAIARHVPRKV